MANILLVEDSLEAQFLAKRAIEKNHQIDLATNLYEARLKMALKPYDMILLDVSLPDGNGMDFCKEIENEGITKRTSVIMLTAKGDVTDKVQGLSSGADDYLAKPFDSRELLARIEAVLKRRGNFEGDIELGPLVISLTEQKVYRKTPQGESIYLDLTPIEFKILLALARRPTDVLTRTELFESVWGKGIHLSVRNIDTHICKLRQKVGETGIALRSSRGKGYILSVPIESKKIKKQMSDLLLPQGTI